MVRIFALLTVFGALIGFTPWLVPVAKQSLRLVEARDDPAAIADLGLRNLDGATVDKEIEAALAADDVTLATSFLELADARAIAVDPALRAKVEAANGSVASALRSAREFGMGFITGQPEDMAGLAGAAASDLMVWGDIRDASREGLKLANGEDPDKLILGLSAVGIAVTAGTYATGGGGLPARVGITLVKVAKRTGKLSAALGRTLMRAVRRSVDFAALRRLGKAPLEADKAALKGVVRTERLRDLTRMLDDVAVVQSKAGTRAALEGLRVADNGGDLRRIASLAEAKGGQTLAILKTLGRGAIVITGALLKIVWWVFVAAAYVYLLISSFNAFCVACVRPLWRRKRRPAARAERRRRWWQRRHGEPARPVPAGTMMEAPGAAAAARFDAAARRAMALMEEATATGPAPARQAAPQAGPRPGAPASWQGTGQPLGSAPRPIAPEAAPLREGSPCPTSAPTESTSRISRKAPVIRFSSSTVSLPLRRSTGWVPPGRGR